MFTDIGFTNGKYSIDENGNVRRNQTGKILKDYVNNKGYRYIDLRIEGRTKRYLVHRLVALTFISNEENYPCVNHKDCNPLNCAVDNLEWCSYSYNNQYGYDMGRKPLTKAQVKARKRPKRYLYKKVFQYSFDGVLVNVFDSLTEAHNKTGFSMSSISACAVGRNTKAHGFIWKYGCND